MGFPPFNDHFVNAVHDLEKDKVFEQQMQATAVAMGTLDENQVSGILALALAKIKNQHRTDKDKRKQTTQDILQQALLHYIDNLNREIADLEGIFETKYGDAWREQIALRILNENDIPQQLSDESIKDYRERLETLLINELLHDDGRIKERYKNNPDLEQYAQWAQKIYNRDVAQSITNDLKNLSITHQQTQEILNKLEEAQNAEQNTYAARALDGHENQKEAVLEIDSNNKFDATTENQSSFSNNFLAPLN